MKAGNRQQLSGDTRPCTNLARHVALHTEPFGSSLAMLIFFSTLQWSFGRWMINLGVLSRLRLS